MKFLEKLAAVIFPTAGSKSRTGSKGEKLAAEFLEKKGFEILERNFRIKGGEADIIGSYKGRTVVVEVKTRTTSRFGTPQAAVDKRKFKRLLLAGRVYCRTRKLPLNLLRIDVVAVELGGGEPSIRHFENVAKPFS